MSTPFVIPAKAGIQGFRLRFKSMGCIEPSKAGALDPRWSLPSAKAWGEDDGKKSWPVVGQVGHV